MIETISQEIYAALRAHAESDPDNADAVCTYRAAEMRIEKGTLRLEP